MPTTPETSSAYAMLARSPIARVVALAVTLGAGFATLSVVVPSLGARAADTAELEARSLPARPPASAPTPVAAPETTATTATAVQNLVAALAADGEVGDDGRSRMPRPAASSRMYRGPVDAWSTMTVYAAHGSPAEALAGYTKVLESQGFTFEDRKPAPVTKNKPASGGANEVATAEASGPSALSKTLRIFAKGDLEAIVTVGAGSSGALLTVIEGPRRSRS